MIRTALSHPWLVLDLGREMQVTSWAPYRPGSVASRHILWREVRNADLPPDRDAGQWLAAEMQRIGRADAVAMLTSRKIAAFVHAAADDGDVRAEAVATVGLSNAVRAAPSGKLPDSAKPAVTAGWGTINIAVALDAGLSAPARLEALSIAASARTAAVLDARLELAEGIATGTGTDCIAVASPAGAQHWCGLHTPQGRALAAAVYRAVHEGATQWMAETGGRAYPLD